MESATPAEAPTPASPPAVPLVPMKPIAATQRIEALDVVRGFALIGIFMMNIEWFNRPFTGLGEGIERGLTGANWWASYFVNYFVQGKFWTIFSLLFGMGFAVMMVRAEQAGREFRRVYLRRVLALATFGGMHFVFLWDGDILFTYAVAALLLMVALYGRPKPVLIAIAALIGLGFIPDFDKFFAVATGVAIAGLVGVYLRSDKHVKLRGRAIPIFSFLVFILGTGLCIAAIVFWLLPDGPTEPRVPLTVFGPLVLLAGWLSWKYREPVELRGLRLGASLYLFVAMAMTVGAVVQHFAPDPDAPQAIAARQAADDRKAAAASAAAKALPASEAASQAAQAPKKTQAERAAERKAEREKRLAERKADAEKELRIYTTGTYAQTVDLRARAFPGSAAGDFGNSLLFIGVFLIGGWFVRSGVMDNTAAHLPLFRKLAFRALPVGIGLGLLGSLIAVSHTAGDRTDGWGIARGLLFMGNLAACVGYVGLVVLMLHSNSFFSRIRVLAPMGRMALTNYVTQSLICTLYFYGYGLGQWGMPRAQQLLFVVAVYSAQVAFSHWWLSKFRYGPMEWFWRGFTYRQLPPFKR